MGTDAVTAQTQVPNARAGQVATVAAGRVWWHLAAAESRLVVAEDPLSAGHMAVEAANAVARMEVVSVHVILAGWARGLDRQPLSQNRASRSVVTTAAIGTYPTGALCTPHAVALPCGSRS